MRMSHVWLHNTETDGYWEAPEPLVEQLLASGQWERCEQPPEYAHATAEHAAWRDAQAAAAEDHAAEEAETPKPTRARRSSSAPTEE